MSLLGAASPFSVLLLGFLLGLRHALDPDHVAAVAATVARHPGRRAVWAGAWWGGGHAAALVLAGGLVVVLGGRVPEQVAELAEAVVGLILIAVGVDVLRTLRRERLHVHVHEHDGARHVHLHAHPQVVRTSPDAHEHDHRALGRRAFVVGAAHGTAGSAGVTVLLGLTARSPVEAIAFLVVFGLAAALAMALAAMIVSLPLRAGHGVGIGPLHWARALSGFIAIAIGLRLVAVGLVAGGWW